MKGGFRPGAGRPRSGKAMKVLPVALPQEVLVTLQELADKDSTSRAAIVRHFVEMALRGMKKGNRS